MEEIRAWSRVVGGCNITSQGHDLRNQLSHPNSQSQGENMSHHGELMLSWESTGTLPPLPLPTTPTIVGVMARVVDMYEREHRELVAFADHRDEPPPPVAGETENIRPSKQGGSRR
nr:hypothetical protein Iba_chr02bCG6730 [Ipomoea batatas]